MLALWKHLAKYELSKYKVRNQPSGNVIIVDLYRIDKSFVLRYDNEGTNL